MCIGHSLEPGCGARVSRKSISVVDSFSLPQLLVAVLASWGSQDEGNWNLEYSFLAPSRVHNCKTDREWPIKQLVHFTSSKFRASIKPTTTNRMRDSFDDRPLEVRERHFLERHGLMAQFEKEDAE